MHREPEQKPAPNRRSLISLTAPGEWPTDITDLPLFLTQDQLAHLLGKSVRTLERDRHIGHSIPFTKVGRKVFYGRADVLSHLAGSSFTSTRDAKAARSA